MTIAMIGMGANLGDPIQQIVDARGLLLALEDSRSGRCSSLYWSSPVGFSEQEKFVNCVYELHTDASASELLGELQAIETALGRRRDETNQNAPRRIDLDLLLFGDQEISTERLIVPHPRMQQRLFVLLPLHELEPDLNLDNFGPIRDLITKLNASSDQVLQRLSV